MVEPHNPLLRRRGRLLHDRVTQLGSGVDNAVRRISLTYNWLGLIEKITSWNDATVGNGSVVNEVKQAFNSFRQLSQEWQEHTGAVDDNETLSAQYAYANASANHVRRNATTYPDGRVITQNYGTADAMDDVLSRVFALIDSDQGATHLAEYTYLGAEEFVQVDYPQPDVRYNLITGTGDDPYDGLDRFNRLLTVLWEYYGSSPAVDREKIGYQYDYASNRTARDNGVASGAQDEVYDYDGLYQLQQLQRGTLSGGQMGSVVWQEDFLFDPTGNWHDSSQDGRGYVTAVNGTEDLVQNRTHNQANEITDITETTGAAWATPAHDAAGNMTTIPRPASPTNSYICVYDPWNRLVKIKLDASTVLAEYAYDGLMRRIKKTTDDEVRHYYYSDQWQVIEERVEVENEDIELVLDRQWVWGIRRLDDLVLRDRDTDADGNLDERLYGLSDALNLTALVNTSGTVVERYGYNAFGTSRVMAADWSARSSSDYDWEVRFGGYRWDGETALYQVRFRYLHAGLGRWLSRDPIERTAGDNFLCYCLNNGLSNNDPLGLVMLKTVIVVVVLGVIIIVVYYRKVEPLFQKIEEVDTKVRDIQQLVRMLESGITQLERHLRRNPQTDYEATKGCVVLGQRNVFGGYLTPASDSLPPGVRNLISYFENAFEFNNVTAAQSHLGPVIAHRSREYYSLWVETEIQRLQYAVRVLNEEARRRLREGIGLE